MPEAARHAPERDHEEVVIESTSCEVHPLRGEVDGVHLVEPHAHVWLIAKNGAGWLRDFRRGQARGGDLIQQRLKGLMILPIYEHYPRPQVTENLAERQSTEYCAEHQDMRGLGFHPDRMAQCDVGSHAGKFAASGDRGKRE